MAISSESGCLCGVLRPMCMYSTLIVSREKGGGGNHSITPNQHAEFILHVRLAALVHDKGENLFLALEFLATRPNS